MADVVIDCAKLDRNGVSVKDYKGAALSLRRPLPSSEQRTNGRLYRDWRRCDEGYRSHTTDARWADREAKGGNHIG